MYSQSLGGVNPTVEQHVEITRRTPTCFLFVIDQSASMAQQFGERPILTGDNPLAASVAPSKAQAVADALNHLLRNLIIMASKSDGVRNYYEVGVLGYGSSGGHRAGFSWGGALAGSQLLPIRDVAQNFLHLAEAAPGQPAQPIWIEPRAKGSTPMCEALHYAYHVLEPWTLRNTNSHPPVVIHITDGEATDGDPRPLLGALRELRTAAGRTILFNVHLSSNRGATPTFCPENNDGLPDAYAELLFEYSSYLTPFMRTIAWENDVFLGEAARAFVLNADPSLVALALEIGTRPGRLI